jgi:hypothetical protein
MCTAVPKNEGRKERIQNGREEKVHEGMARFSSLHTLMLLPQHCKEEEEEA